MPITQTWDEKLSGRTLQYVCEGKTFDTLTQAMNYRRSLR